MGNIFSTSTERNIVLIGSTGNGKSSAGNMILRKQDFITKASANSVTTKCQRSENRINEQKITVIDTPDFFDIDDKDEEEMKSEIVRVLVECAEGIHAFVIVLKVGRYTATERKMVKQLLDTLTEDVWKHTLILFTFGEQLEGQDIKEFVQSNGQLQRLVEACDGRCHVIDKKYWKKHKKKKVMKNLLKTIEKMVKNYGCYSNDLFKKVKEQIQEEMRKNATEEEAKNNVLGTFLKWLAGATVQTLVHFGLSGRGEAVSVLTGMIADGLQTLVVNTIFKAEDADSACDGRSKAAPTNYEHAITLIKKAQTELETAKDMLESATTILQKK